MAARSAEGCPGLGTAMLQEALPEEFGSSGCLFLGEARTPCQQPGLR